MSKLSVRNIRGSANKIYVKADELTEIYNQIQDILNELDSNMKRYIDRMKTNKFYTEGEAKKAINVLGSANEKFLELTENYERMSSAIVFSLEEMMRKDEDIAQRIIGNLKV